MNEITDVMEILEIKHLAPYLPYGVKFISELDKPYDEFGRQPIWTINGIHELFGGYSLLTKDNNDSYAITKCKPLLRPLSDITKEIEHNGEKFVPLKRITKEYYDPDNETIFDNENLFKIVYNKYCYPSNNKRTSHWWLSYNEESISFDNQEVESVLPQYRLLQKLFEWHFDLFGLIEKGLAVSYNDL